MAVGATATGCGCGRWSCSDWRTRRRLSIRVCHFPPGTSKWNKVEHRLFSFISSNWRGEPLRDYETVVRLIADTTTAKGLTVKCRLDRRKYPRGQEISDEELAAINITPLRFHGEWNYIIRPKDRGSCKCYLFTRSNDQRFGIRGYVGRANPMTFTSPSTRGVRHGAYFPSIP